MATMPASAAEVLARSPLFDGVDPGRREAVAAALAPAHWPRNSMVMGPATLCERFHVLADGRVKVTRQNADSGREVTLFLLGPGDGCSLVSLLDTLPETLSVQTLDPVTTWSAPAELWRGWMDADPVFRRAVYRYTHRHLRMLSELASDLALHDTMTRLAHLLLRYCDECLSNDHCRLISDLPNEELAHMIGTVRVVVNRLLGELRREGVIDTDGGRLRILDLEKLVERAERRPRRTAAGAGGRRPPPPEL